MLKGIIIFFVIIGGIMFLTGATTEVIVVPRSTSIEYVPSSIQLIAGTSTNTISDLNILLDGNVYDLTETTGANAIQLDINFTNIVNFSGITARAFYDGATTHAVRIQLFNYNTSNWDVIHTLNDGRDYETHTKSVATSSNYLQNGLVQSRFLQTENGNTSHNLYIDYFALRLS